MGSGVNQYALGYCNTNKITKNSDVYINLSELELSYANYDLQEKYLKEEVAHNKIIQTKGYPPNVRANAEPYDIRYHLVHEIGHSLHFKTRI